MKTPIAPPRILLAAWLSMELRVPLRYAAVAALPPIGKGRAPKGKHRSTGFALRARPGMAAIRGIAERRHSRIARIGNDQTPRS